VISNSPFAINHPYQNINNALLYISNIYSNAGYVKWKLKNIAVRKASLPNHREKRRDDVGEIPDF